MWRTDQCSMLMLVINFIFGVNLLHVHSLSSDQCSCVDTFSSFMSRASDEYKQDALNRFARESEVDSNRDALLRLWTRDRASGGSEQLQAMIRSLRAPVCEVCLQLGWQLC